MNRPDVETLLELRRKALKAEDSLRDSYSQHAQMKQGLVESATKFFKPVIEPLQEVKTEVTGVKKEIHDKEIKPVLSYLPTATKPPMLLPLQKPATITPKVFDEPLFGLHQVETFTEDEYVFGAIWDLDKNVTPESLTDKPPIWSHRIFTNLEEGLLTAYRNDGLSTDDNFLEIKLTEDLFEVLTEDTIKVSTEVKNNYLKLIHYCIGQELKELAAKTLSDFVDEDSVIEKFKRVKKFNEWIAPKYIIKTRSSARSKKGQGQEHREGLHDVADSTRIVIPNEFQDQMKRMILLLGASKSGNKEGNLDEFTAILDTMKANKKLGKKGYKILLDDFSSPINTTT